MNNYKYSSDGKMRDIHSVTVSDSRRKALEAAFPNPTGMTPGVDLDTIPYDEAIREYHTLLTHFHGLHEWGINNLSATRGFIAAMQHRTFGEDGHKVKVTRIIRNALVQMGVDLSSGSEDNKFYEKWLTGYVARFRHEPLHYEVRWDIDAFDMLGHVPGVDDGDSPRPSCYHRGGDYWPDAPVTLAHGLGFDALTFVVLLKDNDNSEYLGRCWGILSDQDIAILSNGYYAERGIHRNMVVFERAVELAHGNDLEYNVCEGFHAHYTLPVYTNSDTIVCWEKGTPEPTDGFVRSAFNMYASGGCPACGNHHNHSNHEFKHLFCGPCAKGHSNHDVPVYGGDPEELVTGLFHCHSCGESLGTIDDENMYPCSVCNRIFCEDCWNIAHCYCDNCLEVICEDSNDCMNHVIVSARAGEVTVMETWCNDCTSNDATNCGGCGAIYHNGNMGECPRGCTHCANCGWDYNPESYQSCPSCNH